MPALLLGLGQEDLLPGLPFSLSMPGFVHFYEMQFMGCHNRGAVETTSAKHSKIPKILDFTHFLGGISKIS